MKLVHALMAVIAVIVVIGAGLLLVLSLLMAVALGQIGSIDAASAEAAGTDAATLQATANQLGLFAVLGVVWSVLAIVLGVYVLYVIFKKKLA